MIRRSQVLVVLGSAALVLAGITAPGMNPPDQTSLVPSAVHSVAPSSRYLELLPDGETKRKFILDCTGCHQFDRQQITVGNTRLKSAAEWRTRTDQMLSFAGAHTSFPILSPSRQSGSTARWLVAALGDETAPVPDPAPLADTHEGVTFTEYDYPNRADIPHDLELDPAGNVIITGQLSGSMYTLNPVDSTFIRTGIPVPQANPRALTIDADGTWWVLLGGPEKIARRSPIDGTWDTFDIGMHPHSIVRTADGRVWFNGHFSKNPETMGALDPTSGDVQVYNVPSPAMPDGGSTIPYGLRAGPDGTLWGTQLVGGRLVKFVPSTGAFSLYPLPTPFSGPRRLDVAPDGTVWIPLYAAGRLAKFDPVSETFTEYDLPVKDALPYIVRVDADRGWVWVATAAADALLRFHLADESFTVHPYPTPRSLVRHMTLDKATGDLWFSYGNFPAVSPKIVRATTSAN